MSSSGTDWAFADSGDGDRMLLRDATIDDIPLIAPFFRAIVEAGETYALPPGLGDHEIAALWLEKPPGRTFVAVAESGVILGTAKVAPNRPARGSHIATASFMVNPVAQNQGIGRLLGEEAIRWARQQGYLGMQFNAVVETNRAAVHLWESLGFRILATVPGAFDHPSAGLVGLHIMFQSFTEQAN